jgi:hypothetical protein
MRKPPKAPRVRSWRNGQPVYTGCAHGGCCDKAAPVSHVHAQHARGIHVEGDEVPWLMECYSCGAVCTCEV